MFCPGMEKNDEKFSGPPKMRDVPPKMGPKCAKLKAAVKFEYIRLYYAKFPAGTEKKFKKFWSPPKMKDVPLKRAPICAKNQKSVKSKSCPKARRQSKFDTTH